MDTFMQEAEKVAQLLPQLLQRRGLDPGVLSRYCLTRHNGQAWLFAVLEHTERMERYSDPKVLHHLSSELGGKAVIISNTTGLRYAILVSNKPKLPKSIEYPGWRKGLLALGVTMYGELSMTWAELGHCLVAGMTRAGKSNFLRLIASQAITENYQLLIIDPDGTTFPALVGHPNVLGYCDTLAGAGEIADQAKALMIDRRPKYTAVTYGYPEPNYPRLLVIIDEYNGLVHTTGGPRANFAQAINQLAYGSLKCNIHLILAGHEFTRQIVGPVAGQMKTRLCFQVKAPSTSRLVIGRAGAERITTPGRALTESWGLLQTYRTQLTELDIPAGLGLLPKEQAMVDIIHGQYNGRLTYEALMTGLGLTRSKAKQVRDDWVMRGLAKPAPEEDNTLLLCVGKEDYD